MQTRSILQVKVVISRERIEKVNTFPMFSVITKYLIASEIR